MKKFVALTLAIVMAFGLVACSGDGGNGGSGNANVTFGKPLADFLEDIRTNYEETTPMLMNLTDEDLEAFYGLDPALLDEYVCAIPMMMVHSTEVFAAKVKDGSMDAVRTAIDNRKASLEETWSSYLPEQYDLVQNAQVVENGSYILFVVHENAADIVNDFNGGFTK